MPLCVARAYLIARATRRRGGVCGPAAIPLALFVLVVRQLLALPLQYGFTRHLEAEADWVALETARDRRRGTPLRAAGNDEPHGSGPADLVVSAHADAPDAHPADRDGGGLEGRPVRLAIEGIARLAEMARSVVVSAVRTPFGKLGGALKNYEAPELGAVAIRGALDRAGIENQDVEYVIMGQVLQAGAGQAPARQASVGAGLPKEIGSDVINKVCASSVRAVEMGTR